MSLLRTTLRATRVAKNPFAMSFSRNLSKVSLPTLDFEFDALEPFISGEINKIHYTKHHQTYVNNYNATVEKLNEAIQNGDRKAQVDLLPLLNFNAGGDLNHRLFWKNLAPVENGGGKPPAPESKFAKAVDAQYGSLENLINVVNAKLAGIQGSGWAWIVKNKTTGNLDVITTKDQDTVPAGFIPLVGIDAWEHAYYLQYQNVKVDYFKAIWNVINWQEAAKRYDESA